MRGIRLVLLAAAAGGCGGQMILSAPDVAVLPGQTAPVVMRLQRQEFWRHCPPLAGEPVLLRRADAAPRCARTDKDGFALLAVPAPDKVGRHEFELHHQNSLGDTVTAHVAVYVLDPDAPIAILDLDSLPAAGPEAAEAGEALRRVAQAAQVVYATARHAMAPGRAHRLLTERGMPDGPVVPVSPPRPWYLRVPWREGPANPVAVLRQRLPGLQWGIAAADAQAGQFLGAGLTVLAVGPPSVRGEAPAGGVRHFGSWPQLVLPAKAADPPAP